MRNNNERAGLKDNTPSADSDVPITSNTEISFICPTEMVDLPTKGKFYPKDHPLHKVEAIEIRYMTAKDEEILGSKTLLQKGVALDKMLQGLLTNQAIKIDDLFIGDKNALVLAARITGYNKEYKTNVTCTSCGQKTSHEFDLNLIKFKEVAEDVSIADDGTFDVILPKSKAKVTLKMLTGNDEKSLKIIAEKKAKHKLPESKITDQLKQIICTINNDNDPEFVSKFVDNMLAQDSRFIREEYNRVFPNVDLKQDFECPVCYAQLQINIPFTAEFFWPG